VEIVFRPECQEINLLLDRMRIQQIIINLLSNAIKFSSEDDRIKVKVSLENVDEDPVLVIIKVVDQGIGISLEDLDNIFSPFFQSSNEESRALNPDSHSIGLNFCYRIS